MLATFRIKLWLMTFAMVACLPVAVQAATFPLTVSALKTSGPSPDPAVVHQETETGLSAEAGTPTPNQEFQITGPTWSWSLIEVQTRSKPTDEWATAPGTSYTISLQHPNTAVPTATMTASFHGVGYWKVTVRATVSYSVSNGDTWTGSDDLDIVVQTETIDMDTDSDNSTMAPNYPDTEQHDGDDNEDTAEDSYACQSLLSNYDDDGNGVPAFADGIDKFDNNGTNRAKEFQPLLIYIPEGADSNLSRITLSYSASDPDGVTRTGSEEDGYTYVAATGAFRIWTKPGESSRKVASADDEGDFVSSGHEYKLSDLGASAGSTVTLYVEAVGKAAASTISVELSGNGTPSVTDSVLMHYYEIGYAANFSDGD